LNDVLDAQDYSEVWTIDRVAAVDFAGIWHLNDHR
jgi:hypothetical protein